MLHSATPTRRQLFALGAGGAAAVSLAACGGSSSGSGSGDSITYWSNWKEGESQQAVMKEAVAAFEEESGITVNVEWQGRQVTQKIVPALNTPQVPDIIDGAFAKLAPVLAATGQVLPLDDLFASEVEGEAITDIIPEKFRNESTMIDGSPWLLPTFLTSEAIWYDAGEHPEISEAPPADWEEFIALLDDLKSQGKTPLAADGDVGGYNVLWFQSLYLRLTGVGGLNELVSDKSGALWDGDAALEAARCVEQIVQGGYLIPGYDASKWPAQQQAWATNDAALLLNGSWIPTETAPYATKDFEYASFPMPSPDPSGETIMRAEPTGFVIPLQAKNPEAAAEFAKFLLRMDFQEKIASEAGQIPIREGIETIPELADISAAIDAADSTYLAADGITHSGYMETVMQPINDELFLGKISAEEFISSAKEAQISYWEAQL
ncbi:ABC transporter substrate-binding protein [Brachybacterium avium]|uniref:ABC transporter substrate-binding protein n=1 Tax=Brachybacterium avium TaxID=2017485 RepID=UPI001FECF9B1|nr:extracellular solute-binding protein [Brachybacterium avium]